MKLSFLRSAFPAVLMALGLATNVAAVPLTGVLNFGGGSATLDFPPGASTTVLSWGAQPTVSFASGNFALVPLGSNIMMGATPWSLNTLSGPAPMWTSVAVPTVYFNLTNSWISQNIPGFLDVKGKGVAYVPGYDPTVGDFEFSMVGPTVKGSIVASTIVPDGGTTALLLGLGLTGMAVLARARRLLV